MRDGRQGQGAAAWLTKAIEKIVLAGLAGCCGFAGPAAAADLGAGPSAPPAVAPPAPPGMARPACRMVPMPRTNLNGYDVVGFPPTWVCVSRGVYADQLPPPPPPPPRPWFWW